MPRAERFARRTDLLWRPKGCATAGEIVGVRFPLWAETAAEITPTIDPNGYHRSPINRPAPPLYETFCSISSSSSCFATDGRAHATVERAAASAVADVAEIHRAGRTIAARASAAHLRPFPVSSFPDLNDLGFRCSSSSSSSSLFFSSTDSSDLAIDYLVPLQCLARYFELALKSVDITW